MKGLSNSGFTVIELLISIGVIAIVIPALASGINNLTVINNRSHDLTLANLIAENKAELLRSTGFNSLTVGTHDFTSELPKEISPIAATYEITNPQNGIKEIDIAITYNDYGNPRTMTYKTIVSELGVSQ